MTCALLGWFDGRSERISFDRDLPDRAMIVRDYVLYSARHV